MTKNMSLTRPSCFVGLQLLGGLSALQFPFTGPINALVTVLGAGLVLTAYLGIYWLLMTPLFKLLSKPSCDWFQQSARTSRWYASDAGGYIRRFTFENPKYAEMFKKANGAETAAPRARAAVPPRAANQAPPAPGTRPPES